MSNSTSSAKPRQRGPVRPARRYVRLVRPIGSESNGDGMVALAANGKAALYWVAEVPTQLDGRAFSVQQVCCTGEAYMVHVGGFTSCECLGFQRHGHCKHTAGLAALIAAGKLASPVTRAEG